MHGVPETLSNVVSPALFSYAELHKTPPPHSFLVPCPVATLLLTEHQRSPAQHMCHLEDTFHFLNECKVFVSHHCPTSSSCPNREYSAFIEENAKYCLNGAHAKWETSSVHNAIRQLLGTEPES